MNEQEAWLRIYCAEVTANAGSAAAKRADAGLLEFRKRAEDTDPSIMEQNVESVLQKWELSFVGAPDELRETIGGLADEVRASMRTAVSTPGETR